MAFDVTNPNDLAALQSEVINDPLNINYAQWIDASTVQFMLLLNDAANNPVVVTTTVELTTGVLLDIMVPDDLGAQQVNDGERRYIEALMNRPFNESIERWRSQIRNAFRLNSDTVLAIDALIRPISRAEVLFGVNTVLTALDWAAARDS